MLRPVSTNISVITNFGCRAKCWYCIWKGHELEKVNDPTDWEKLGAFLSRNKALGKVSVSGGGDSLYRFNEHVGWWNCFMGLAKQNAMLVDVHTREKFKYDSFWKRINRCVFSSDLLSDDRDHLLYLLTLTKLRITHLVTANTTMKMIEEYMAFEDRHGCQFTIKQLVGHDDGGMYERVRKEYPLLFHLDSGDYSVYYMPDNSIRRTFLIQEEK